MKNFLKYTSLVGVMIVSAAKSSAEKLINEGFEEFSPIVEDIQVNRNEHFLEVFVEGWAAMDCFEARDYAVQKLVDRTRIVPRFRKRMPEKKCSKELKKFREKAADLDLSNPASYNLEVLGFHGWHAKKITEEQR